MRRTVSNDDVRACNFLRGARMTNVRRVAVLLAAQLAAAASALGAERAAQVAGLADLSLEQLMNVEVTSVSRRAEPLADAAASIFVISADDIRRSGATSIPEVLRLAPNLIVARADTNQYAISARGFDNVLANKLLVLIDGRIVYTPLFSGVFWEAQDVMLEDVLRIEVISGPGATLWGANAVNGVINIITRDASETRGPLVAIGGGNRENGAAARYGAALGDAGDYRVYARYFHRDHSQLANGTPIRDRSDRAQAGFRTDWRLARDALTLQGDAYVGDIDQAPAARHIAGGNVLARWVRALDEGARLSVQSYYDETHRDHPGSFLENLGIFDIEAQYGWKPLADHRLLVGGGYRAARDRVGNSAAQAFIPPARSLAWANAFVQDEIALPRGVTLTLGAKVETNPFTHVEILPNARVGWRAARDQFVWGAVSRAVRAPSRIDRELVIPGNPPFALAVNGDFESEIATAYELGYRAQPSTAWSWSITLFHEDYDRLRSVRPQAGGAVFANAIEGRSTGVETWATWRIHPRWKLAGGLTAMHERLRVKPGSLDVGGVAALGNDPSAWWSLRSLVDLTPQHEFDVTIRHVGALPNPAVPAYTAVDARLAWRPDPRWEIALVLQDLFDRAHPEWGVPGARAEIERGAFLRVQWKP
jgi:iron complex outermembrane receptor protein